MLIISWIYCILITVIKKKVALKRWPLQQNDKKIPRVSEQGKDELPYYFKVISYIYCYYVLLNRVNLGWGNVRWKYSNMYFIVHQVVRQLLWDGEENMRLSWINVLCNERRANSMHHRQTFLLWGYSKEIKSIFFLVIFQFICDNCNAM